MAKKKSKAAGAMTPGASALTAQQQVRQTVLLVLCAVLSFFAVCMASESTAKGMGLALSILLLVLTCLRFGRLRERMGLPMLLMGALVVWQGISTLYAEAGQPALKAYLKVFDSFCLILILLLLAPERGMKPERWLGAVLTGLCGGVSLVSIDMMSTRLISGLATGILGLFSGDYANLAGVEAGVRMTSLLNDGNVFAGVAGLGVLLGLGLVCSAEGRRERIVQTVILYVNSLAFLLAFSMGATAAIVLAFLAVLALERKDKRASLMILMIETLALCVLAAAIISMVAFKPWDGFQPVPILCAALGAAGLCLLNERAGRPLAAKLADKSRLISVVIAVILAAVVALALAAYNITGSVSLGPGGTLRRAAYPDPGTYSLTVEADGPMIVTVESQDRQQTMMHTCTFLYSGDVAGASFTVPEGSLVVYFDFYSPEGARMNAVSYAGDAGQGSLPLGYKLLPGFIANRLQGLWANENAIQRLVFYSDGLKMFAKHPIFGLGWGAYGNNILNVQTFFYETNDVHNCYIQYLAETGIIGFVLFMAVLAVCAACVWFERKKGGAAHPMTPALGAALLFMAGHGATEVAFSDNVFLPMAYGSIALIGLCCGDALPKPRLKSRAKSLSLAAMTVLIAGYTALLLCNVIAHSIVNAAPTYERVKTAIALDRFTWGDHVVSFISGNLTAAADPETRAQADELAGKLAEEDPTYAPYFLATYYFLTGQYEPAFDMVDASLNSIISSRDVWQAVFDLMETLETDSDVYRAGVLRIVQRLEDWNARSMDHVTLSEETQAFIARIAEQTYEP